MYEEIDLRPYLTTLWQNWVWLIGAAFLAAVVAFLGSQIIPPQYEATALVVIEDQEDFLQFDPRIRTNEDTQLRDAYPDFALSDAVLLGLQNRIDNGSYSINQLQDALSAQTGNDPRLLQLTATQNNPQAAADMANLWANELMDWANLLYGTQSGESLAFYENELISAEMVLQKAEADLVEFQAVNRTAVLSNTLQTHFLTQSQHLAQLNELTLLTEDVAGMQTILRNSPTNAPLALSHELTLIGLQSKVFDTAEESLILQVDPNGSLPESNREDQIALLNQLNEVLGDQITSLEVTLAAMEPEILRLQQDIQASLAEQQQLSRDVLIAEENYLSLARKVSEERISNQDALPPLALVSEAAVPEEPVNQNILLTVITAAFLGLSVIVAFLLLRQWWQSTETPTD